ncbi:MAG: gamma-butyrobetaine hydroxylase-like domain-containing protein [Gammaproteobacteria bacterium]
MAEKPFPAEIKLHSKSRVLEITFNDGHRFDLPCELLRVYSPSADVKGHGPETAVLQTGKEQVNITLIEPVGHYAVRLSFDDGHATGLYSWSYLYDLGMHRDRYWMKYLDALRAAGHQRRPAPS